MNTRLIAFGIDDYKPDPKRSGKLISTEETLVYDLDESVVFPGRTILYFPVECGDDLEFAISGDAAFHAAENQFDQEVKLLNFDDDTEPPWVAEAMRACGWKLLKP